MRHTARSFAKALADVKVMRMQIDSVFWPSAMTQSQRHYCKNDAIHRANGCGD